MSGVNWTRRKLEPERLAKRVDRQRLGHAGRPLEQHVPAGGSRDQRKVDGAVLSHDDARAPRRAPVRRPRSSLSPPLVDACQPACRCERGRIAGGAGGDRIGLVLAQAPRSARGCAARPRRRPQAGRASGAPPPRRARSPRSAGRRAASAPARPSAYSARAGASARPAGCAGPSRRPRASTSAAPGERRAARGRRGSGRAARPSRSRARSRERSRRRPPAAPGRQRPARRPRRRARRGGC